MSKTPQQRAEACFAIARSTTHAGEREAAIGRGTAICEKHGLKLDDFNIPGRGRRAARASVTITIYGSGRSASVSDVIQRFEQVLRRQAESVGAGAGETVDDARRRNFDQACAEAAQRDAKREARA